MKVNQQSGYILHRQSYRESSLLVQIFTRNFGRLTLIAKGCRTKKYQVQGLFLPFKPLLLSWTGKGDLPILTSIEQIGFCPQLDASRVACGYYINELILKLLHRHDPHELLYDKYDKSIFQLTDKKNPNSVLRVFEKYLLQEIGFGLVLDHDAESGETIAEEHSYQYVPQKGPIATNKEQGDIISGSTLIALQNEEFNSAQDRSQARRLTRLLIDIQLNGKELRSRRVMREMKHYREQISNEY
ncbi:DNA repair protein RecO [Candidatus Spongiihabitans sp.]|uniref:DNA repair protein RecO n=1 Tax=Candidatus Spongiihabitans sp. TaxID=3101308 RepID=UPI003C6FAD27